MVSLSVLLIVLSFITWITIPLMNPNLAGKFSFLTSVFIALSSSLYIFFPEHSLTHQTLVEVGILNQPDALSIWFITIVNMVFLAGSFYSLGYLKSYHSRKSDLRLHLFLMPLFHFSMVMVCWVENWFYFLVFWEIMSLSSFLLILFEREKEATIKAAMNYFVQMHISVLFLMSAVYLLWDTTGSLDFSALIDFTASQGVTKTGLLFFLFFVGFAIKAGFVPFHTWLPHAHPAAPSHISGIMSGVIIKMGIYGIFRVILNMNSNLVTAGWILLTIAGFTALYGIMQAIVQHNLKRLLAYSSIENIGIIGIGMGLGTLGLGYHLPVLIFFGFGGALLHVLNHGILKSLLFFATGNIYQATHTLEIDDMGGLAKKMPSTSFFFVLASIGLCAIPPLNGFISEFLIYSGLFQGILMGSFTEKLGFLMVILVVTVTGGMALLAFTKAGGITLLGHPRSHYHETPKESSWISRAPMVVLALLALSVGLLPMFFLYIVQEPLKLLFSSHQLAYTPELASGLGSSLIKIGLLGGLFLTLITLFMLLRQRSVVKHGSDTSGTWGCGYTAPTVKMQYSGASFVRIFRKLFDPIIFVHRQQLHITELYPKPGDRYETQTADRIEDQLIKKPLEKLIDLTAKFRVFQNGQIQYYLLYGFLFILLILLIELI